MRTLVLYRRDTDNYACIVAHSDSFDPSENEEDRERLQDEFTADDNSLLIVELPNDTFRPAITDHNGEEVGVMFLELPTEEE